jgi:hypothetical protein
VWILARRYPEDDSEHGLAQVFAIWIPATDDGGLQPWPLPPQALTSGDHRSVIVLATSRWN